MLKAVFLKGWNIARFIFRWIFKAFRLAALVLGTILMIGLTLGAINLLTE